ncbi:MAG: Crp/Fnr family transcriptional regulator [Caldilineaceae bacterium]|nr:Crp/Fnr family transcriptional regulator [Caldilineaceae bacterium]
MSQRTSEKTLARRIEFLHSIPLFAALSDAELNLLLQDLRPKEYGKDEIVLRQGDESRELYIVFKGKVRIYKVSPSGNETSIAIFGERDIIGEQSAIDGAPRQSSAKAINAVTLLVMSHEAFAHHLQNIPKLMLGLVQLLNQKLRWTAAFAESVAQFDAAGRLLHILLLYNEQYGVRTEENGHVYHVLDLSLNQTDLASLVGARREWVNRILGDWRKRGLMEFNNGVVTILDLQRVTAERDSRIEANQSGEW